MGMSLSMIKMYEGMVKQEFSPLKCFLEERTVQVRQQVEQEVKKELGIYDLYVEETALKVRSKEIEGTLEVYENKGWRNGKYCSRIEEMVENRLTEKDGVLKGLLDAEKTAVKALRLCGAQKEVLKVFEALPLVLEELKKTVKALPPFVQTKSSPRKIGGAG